MILVTGGTGVMGTALLKNLVPRGERVRVVALPGDPGLERARGLGAEVCTGNVADRDSIRGVCDGVDTVCHLAAVIITDNDAVYRSVNVDGTAHVIDEAKKSGVKRFVHVSSASVVYPEPTPYSQSKMDGERLVRESGLNWSIARPTLVYDSCGGIEFNMFLRYLERFAVVPFIGTGAALKRPVHSDDVVAGLAAMCRSDAPVGMVYNLSGAEAISIVDFARLCLTYMGMGRKPIVRIPVAVCRAMATVMGRLMKHPPLSWPVIAGITQDANLDPAEAVRDLGYAPSKVSERMGGCFPRLS